MPERLFIGTRRYSSWSMRGWLAVQLARLDVAVVTIRLTGGCTPEVKKISPGGTVPVLEHGGNRIWDSLAIAEYCAEIAPRLWPADACARAVARAVSAEMHAGFRDLRLAMPMAIGATHPGQGRTRGALADIARLEILWADTRAKFGCAFLFGDFTFADAMFAPVAARFATYEPQLSDASLAYCRALLAHPLVSRWHEDALADDWRDPRYETFAETD